VPQTADRPADRRRAPRPARRRPPAAAGRRQRAAARPAAAAARCHGAPPSCRRDRTAAPRHAACGSPLAPSRALAARRRCSLVPRRAGGGWPRWDRPLTAAAGGRQPPSRPAPELAEQPARGQAQPQRVGRVGRDGLRQAAGQHAGLHGHRGGRGDLAAGGHDGGEADDLVEGLVPGERARAGDELQVAVGVTGGARPVHLVQRHHRHPRPVPVRLVGLLLGQADAADLRVGEGDPGHDAVVEARHAAEAPGQHRAACEGVARGEPSLLVPDVRELQRGGAVAGGEDPPARWCAGTRR
jgi:hypothetical protein